MNKTITLAIILAPLLLAAGCRKCGVVPAVGTQGREIRFAGYASEVPTKSSSVMSAPFRVEAFYSGEGLYFAPTVYTRAGKVWSGVTHYWPDNDLEFCAASPLTYRNTAASPADVDLVPGSDRKLAVTGTDGGTDIAAAYLDDVDSSADTVVLGFGHILTKVSFTAIGQDRTKKYVISDLVLTAGSTSTFTFGSPGSWAASSASYAYDYVTSDVTIPADTSSPQAVGTAKHLIPSQAANLAAVIKYQVLNGTAVIDDQSAGVNLSLPTDLWGMGKSVVYALTIGTGQVSVTGTYTSMSSTDSTW